jgi:WD40 repeat protein
MAAYRVFRTTEPPVHFAGNRHMNTETHLEELLSLWQQGYAAGQDLSAAELCRHSPELLPELEQRIAVLRHMQQLLHTQDLLATSVQPSSAPRQAPAPPPALPGYEILDELGRGGMGVVYKARQVGLNRLVALKMVLAGTHAAAPDLLRFRTEAEAIARLVHPHIVQIHEIGQHEGRPFFSLEFCPGGSLDKKLAGTPLPPREAARLVASLAQAMQVAHEAGVVHRDLKPANVLLAADGTPKITDFGLAKKLDDCSGQTQTGQIMGTPSYMAPEQAAGTGQPIGPAADVYALGAIRYEMLAGRPPFKGASVLETLDQVQHQEPVPPCRLTPKVPRDLETICLKCLEKEPKKRYDSALALEQDLQRFLDGEPIRARPVTPLHRALKWVRRRPALAAAYGLLALAVVFGGLGGGATWLWRRAEGARKEAEAARRQLTVLSYIHQIGLAQREWQEGDVAHVEQLLQSCPEGMRGWEWRYVHRLCHSELFTLRGHAGGIAGVAFNPDGTRLASASNDGTVRVWDTENGREVRSFRGHSTVAFSPDGTHLASAGDNGKVVLWSCETGGEIRSLAGHTDHVNGVAFSPDGTCLASASDDQTARLWDLRTGGEVLTLRGLFGNVEGLAFTPDGQQLAAGSSEPWHDGGGITIWDTRTGQKVRSFQTPYRINGIALSPDGRQLAGACGDQAVRVWETNSGRDVCTLWGHAGLIYGVAFSPDGKHLASCGDDQTVKVWDLAVGRELFSLRGHRAGVLRVAFSPDGRRLASASGDQTLKIWEVSENQPTVPLRGGTGMIWGVAFDPDSRLLASATHEGAVQVWDVTAKELVRSFPAHEKVASCVAFRQDGKVLASGGNDRLVKVWDAKTGAAIAALPPFTAAIQGIALSPDGRLLASASADWDPKNGYVNGEVKIWDLQAHTEPFTLTTAPSVDCVAFSPDGQRLAYGGEQGVTVCEVPTGKPVLSVQGHDALVSCIAFSSDGQRLASAGWDKMVRVWDAVTGAPLLTLQGHTLRVTSVAFSPDGRRIASGGDDRTIRLFNADSGDEVLSLRASLGPVHCLAFSPDGFYLASGGWDGVVRLWDARPVAAAR